MAVNAAANVVASAASEDSAAAAAAAADSASVADADAEKVDHEVTVFGIDPGTVNMGLCEMRISAGVSKVMALERVEFRQTGTGGNDLGNAKIVDAVNVWLDTFVRERVNTKAHVIVFIEDQMAAKMTRKKMCESCGMHCTRCRTPEDAALEAQAGERTYQGSNALEILAVQHTIQARFGSSLCVPVAPRAVKARYPEVFKRVEPYTPSKQYYWDKKNARVMGAGLVSKHVRKIYEEANPTKKDDAYDALWVAKFGADFWLEQDDHTLRSEIVPDTRTYKKAVVRRAPGSKVEEVLKAKAIARAKREQIRADNATHKRKRKTPPKKTVAKTHSPGKADAVDDDEGAKLSDASVLSFQPMKRRRRAAARKATEQVKLTVRTARTLERREKKLDPTQEMLATYFGKETDSSSSSSDSDASFSGESASEDDDTSSSESSSSTSSDSTDDSE